MKNRMDNKPVAVSDYLVLKQLPVIEEHLYELKDQIKERIAYAESLVCTVDNLPDFKRELAALRKEFNEFETQRKMLKKAINKSYADTEMVYNDCVRDQYMRGIATLSGIVDDTEDAIKAPCEEEMREFFAELCTVNHTEWLKFEQSGIKIGLTDARQESHKKLKAQLTEFVVSVANSVECLAKMEYPDELIVEFKRTLDLRGTINTVDERHKRMEQERQALEASSDVRQREQEAVAKVDAIAPPTVVDVAEEKVYNCTFSVHATKDKLKKLKEFLVCNDINFETEVSK